MDADPATQHDAPNGITPLLAPEDATDETSPRALVQYTISRSRGGGIDHYAWEAVQPQGVISDGPGYKRDIVGFAELPRNQPVGRFNDPDEFVEHIEDAAVYVHWKPNLARGATDDSEIEQ